MGGGFGYCGVIGYREPVLDSLWQKWGFHARLVANAVLLIWLASKNLEGARTPPLLSSCFSGSARKSPHLFGPLPNVWTQQCFGPTFTLSPCSLSSPHSAKLYTCCCSLFLDWLHHQNNSPSSSFIPAFFLSFIWYVNRWPVSVSSSFYLRSRVFILKTEQSESIPLFLVFESHASWQRCLKFLLQTLAAEKRMWQLDKCLACWP